ncbi:ferredoxin reductase family protein [Pilimelia columellifera]|uniref:Ferredoxin reductase family protein n=1 Tax=Pilimelia columellifera subsp. columellifera TaxID=706583 RepID=A0ABN3N2B2_9ACTN
MSSATKAYPRAVPVRTARLEPRRTLRPIGAGPGGPAVGRAVPGAAPRLGVGQLFDDTAERHIIRHKLHAEESAGNRLLVILLFWGMLVTSVAVWLYDTAPGSLVTTSDIAIAVGRITGMIGGYLLLVQVAMASRVAWIEQWVGGRDIMRWHRWIGTSLLVAVLAHAVFITWGYGLTTGTPLTEQAWKMLALEDMVSATASTGVLVAVALLAIRGVRKLLPYEVWHFLHMGGYAALLLGFGHQFALGANLTNGFAYWFWSALYALTIAVLAWGRLIEPLWFNARHQLRVSETVQESPDTFSIYLTGRHLDDIGVKAGQYFRWRFLTSGGWWQSHPFSLSAAPNPRHLRITVTAVGGHTASLRELSPGTRVLADGPSGVFTADRRTTNRALLVAVGSGIAPIRAICEQMPQDTVLIYRARSEQDLALKAELDKLATSRGMTVRYVLGSRDDEEPRELFTPGGLGRYVPDIAERDIYICGPGGFVTDLCAKLRRLQVPARQIHLDPFEF